MVFGATWSLDLNISHSSLIEIGIRVFPVKLFRIFVLSILFDWIAFVFILLNATFFIHVDKLFFFFFFTSFIYLFQTWVTITNAYIFFLCVFLWNFIPPTQSFIFKREYPRSQILQEDKKRLNRLTRWKILFWKTDESMFQV